MRSWNEAKTGTLQVEPRMQIMGYSLFGRLLLVVHVEVHNEATIRIISARSLDPKERRRLERQ